MSKKKQQIRTAWTSTADPVEEVKKPSDQLVQPRHELFCVLYAGVGTRLFFGNAQQCYMEAYGFSKEMHDLEVALLLEDNKRKRKDMTRRQKSIKIVCTTAGSRLLTNPVIRKRIAFLLDEHVSHDVADRELVKVIVQDYDLRSKVDAIKEYNRVTDRVKDAKLTGELKISWAEDVKHTKPAK